MIKNIIIKRKEEGRDEKSADFAVLPVTGAAIAVVGSKGGVGTSTIALDLAVALSLRSLTVVTDANLQQPDLAHMLNSEPRHSFLEMLTRPRELDEHMLDACSTRVGEGPSQLALLSPPLDGQAAIKTNLTELANCIKELKPLRKYWVVDMPHNLDRHFVTMTDLCEKIVLVFEATVTGVAAAQRWLKIFHELGYSSDRIIMVLNRAGSKYSGIEQQLQTCFPTREILRLPNASSLMWDASTKGISALSLSFNHAYSKAVLKIAQKLVEIEEAN